MPVRRFPDRHFFMEQEMPTDTDFSGVLSLRPEDLDELLTRAAEKGAERALAALGLENGHAAKDIRDLRGLIEAWRQARQTAWQTLIKLVLTYWFMALYCAAKTAAFVAVVTAGATWGTAILHAWTEADQALWAGMLNFWFLGRVFDRVRL